MLQPRLRRCIALVCLVSVFAKGLKDDEWLQGSETGARLKRENGDVTVLSLEESGKVKDAPVGVLSSTARTFVNGGATTEFATQIIGTTVGRTYARLLSTGSRVFYDNQVRPTKEPPVFLVFPTLTTSPTMATTAVEGITAEVPVAATTDTNLPVVVTEQMVNLQSLNEIYERETTQQSPVVSVRKEFSVKRNTEVKPAKVKPKSDLPTVTIKAEFAPSGYSDLIDDPRKEVKRPRGGKGLFRGGVQIKNDLVKYDTVTYVGFADFTTTVGNTVIIFMPKTAAANQGAVTSIAGAATLRPEDALSAPVVTTVKTFMSHSPGMATKTVTGHNINMHTSLPTVQADTRASKAYNPVFVTADVPETTTSGEQTTEAGVLTTEREWATTEQDAPTTERRLLETTTEKRPETTTDKRQETTTERRLEETTMNELESAEPEIPGDDIRPTEALKMTPSQSTIETRVFIAGDRPLGLAKTISAIQIQDDKTIYLKSFLFGTVIDGEYSLLTQVVSTTASIEPTKASSVMRQSESMTLEPTTEEAPTTEKEETSTEQEPSFITKLVPTTIFQTYTYFTTFFIPQDGTQSTSIRTREVTSDEVRYVTTLQPAHEIAATTAASISETTITETPRLPTTTPEATNQITSEEPITTTSPSPSEEEVEVIIRTLYTTYTYFTTFFQETSTSIQSREVVKTNVVTSTLDVSSIPPEASDPAVAGLFNEVRPTSVMERPPTLKTYTYYTTVFVDGETLIESRTEVVPEPTSVVMQSSKTVSVEENNIVPVNDIREKGYETIARGPALPSSEALVMSSIDDAYAYDTTMARNDRISATVSPAGDKENDDVVLKAKEKELKKEALVAMGLDGDSEVVETMVTDVTSSSSGGPRRKSYEEYETDPNDQISSESNTEEIEPSSVLLQTSYTTFTYFTTVYKGTTSDIISRLETVTNVVTETVKPTEIEPKLSPEEATLPITYFTTFTYWTTLYRGTSTMITSREETVSNIVTPTVTSILATPVVELTTAPVIATKLITSAGVSEIEASTSSQAPEEVVSTSTVDAVSPTVAKSTTPKANESEPTTYYTTFTYFTTSYLGSETIINSHLETETNVVLPTETSPSVASSTDTTPELPSAASSSLSAQPTGLISTIRTSLVNDGITTLLNTDVYGTFIDGLYAQVLESSSEVVVPTTSSSVQSISETQPTGIVSINEGKIIDADGVSTTVFTTKAVGTIIDALYAQVIESTSSIIVDEAKKTALPAEKPSTTTLGSKVYTTGLVRLIEGSIIKDKTTTFYESRVIGTLIDGRYAQIIESTSSFKSESLSTTPVSPTSTVPPGSVISPTATSTSAPSPDVIESSIDSDEDESNKGRLGGKKKAFTPQIRPFSSRARVSFSPRKKTGDPATTITRTSSTPTITATPATKSGFGFGSSRNRFGANRSRSSAVAAEIKPTASSSSRRFSRPRSSTPAGAVGGIGSRTRGSPTRSSSATGAPAISSSRSRSGFNYRSTARPPLIGVSSSLRPRIRPTASSRVPTSTPATSVPEDDINNNDITATAGDEEAADDEDQTTAAPIPPTTTTESSRRAGNPLLRFRRPPILQRASTPSTTTTLKPATTPKRTTSLLRRPDTRGARPTRPTPPPFSSRPKQRPASSLFPPRGLIKKPGTQESTTEAEEAEEKKPEEEDQEEEEIQDNEYEGSETAEQTSSSTTTTEAPKRKSKGLSPVLQIRPFTRRPRVKRQSEWGSRGSYSSRYRRPPPQAQVQEEEPPATQPPPPTRSSFRNRNGARLRPSPVASTPRHQFTLRDRSYQQTTSPPTSPPSRSFRRPTGPSNRRRSQTTEPVTQRPKSPTTRLRTTTEAPPSRATSRRYNQQQNSRRTTTRARYRGDPTEHDTYSPKTFDGTITVTHQVPQETVIPVINGKNTEYKSIITAKPSLEILGPQQYSTTVKDGKQMIVLTSEVTSPLTNGFMEVTKFFVYETPTTSITFTPTTIRGRKTSYSHVLPSTVYEVRPDVSTVQPNLASGAPLANLLLSQLLLGNLAAQPTAQAQSPTTEFKTKTTTYVTTVTSHTSTILPLTFRGKEITTTIIDSSTHVITATEYITETIVITPTAVIPPALNNQLNTLLLPALLQPLLQQQNSAQQPQQDLFGINKPISNEEPDQRFNRRENDYDDDDDIDERPIRESSEEKAEVKQVRKKAKVKVKTKKEEVASSVITLYVSGKHPGEFTTLLSTVPVSHDSGVHKREISPAQLVVIKPSITPQLGSSFLEDDYFSNHIAPPSNILIESSEVETVSIDPYTKSLPLHHAQLSENKKSTTDHFLWVGYADTAPFQRNASSRSKREIDSIDNDSSKDTPSRRRVVRVRIPRGRKVAQQSEQMEVQLEPPKERVLLKKVGQVGRKRVLVTRRRPVQEEEDRTEEEIETTTPTPAEEKPRRRKVIKSIKRILTPVQPTIKKRITVTRKRPVPTPVPVEDMSTLYQFQYSIPAGQKNSSVTVSEIFMMGDDLGDADIPKEMMAEIHALESTPVKIPVKATVIRGESLYGGDKSENTGDDEEKVDEEDQEYVEYDENNGENTTEEQSYVTIFPHDEETTTTMTGEQSSYVTLFPYDEELTTEPPIESTQTSEASYVTLFPYDKETSSSTVKASSATLDSSRVTLFSASAEPPTPEPTYVTLFPYDEELTTEPPIESTQTSEASYVTLFPYDKDTSSSTVKASSATLDSSHVTLFPDETTHISVSSTTEAPEQMSSKTFPPTNAIIPTPILSTTVKVTTSTRFRTYTYVVTKVSGDEKYVTSSTSVRPDVRTLTVTETLTLSPSVTSESGATKAVHEGRGLHVFEPRYNLATKVMANGVEVIVAGDKSTLPGSPQLRVIPSGLAKPITLAPSTLTDHMMMLLPQDSQKPHNDFVTKTYMTTYTYMTTFSQETSTVVSSHEKVVWNVVTEGINPTKVRPTDHFTLTASPKLTTGVYHTTYTYLNTLVDGEQPLVVTSKKTVSNTVTEQPVTVQPSEVPVQDTNTYLSTVAYTKTLSEGDELKVVSTEDVLTQVIITESDYLPSSVDSALNIEPTHTTTDVTKTYFATYTYFNTVVDEKGATVVNTEVATSSDVVTETFTIHPKKPTSTMASASAVDSEDEANSSGGVYATKTYLTTFTYFTTLSQDKSPTIVVKSRTKVQQNVVTETVDSANLDSNYLDLIGSSSTETPKDTVRPTITPTPTPSNVVTGSTIIFFDDQDEAESKPKPSSSKTLSPTQLSTKKPSLDPVQVDTPAAPSNTVGQIFNGLNALGPVINAMADLFQNNFNQKKVKPLLIETARPPPTPSQPVAPALPVPSAQQRPKRPAFQRLPDLPTTTDRPSPVFHVADSEPSESQAVPAAYPDTIQRTKSGVSDSSLLLSGGIPISPGQVITTNSDIIIGKHSAHGPRPPPHKKQTLNLGGGVEEVEGMKPPPPPKDQDIYPSIHHPVAPNQVPPPQPPYYFNKHPNLHHRPEHKNDASVSPSQKRPRPPSSPEGHLTFRPPHQNHHHHHHHHPPSQQPPADLPTHPTHREDFPIPPQHFINSGPQDPEMQTLSTPPPPRPPPALAQVKPIHGIPSTSSPQIQSNDNVVSGDYDNPLLVNIQPSQVANVIIPHGVSTALVFGPEHKGQKGEIFSEPSPYPDAEVGIGGSAGEDSAHMPPNAVRMDVPVAPHSKRRPDHTIRLPLPPTQSSPPAEFYPNQPGSLEYLTPPPAPNSLPGPSPISTYVNYHLGGNEPLVEDQEGDYSVNNEFHTESDEISTPLKTKPRPTNNFTDDRIQYSVINSKPVLLGFDSIEKQPPIIKGKPGVVPFDNTDQATVSIGHPTKLAPSDVIAPEVRPVNPKSPLRQNISSQSSPSPAPTPFDNTVYAMNMDERPPPPTTYETPSVVDFEVGDSQQDKSVVGLTPPPPSRRPFLTRRPLRKRPTLPQPPYKFEIPLPSLNVNRPPPSYLESERPPPPPPSPPTTSKPPPSPTVLHGTLTVAELPQKPEVITADSKVSLNDLDHINVKPQKEVNSNPTHLFVPTGVPALEPSTDVFFGSETVFPKVDDQTTILKSSTSRPAYVTPVRAQSIIPIRLVPKNITTDGYTMNTIILSASPSTYIVTHTQTLTVTTTESMVIQSKGQKPSTHTLVVTKTQTSTVLDTVTEVHTLLRPTSILQTVTTTATATLPQATATVTAVLPTPSTPPAPPSKAAQDAEDSILVVMTDKNSKPAQSPTYELGPPLEIEGPSELDDNEISQNVLLGGFLSHPASNPANECRPECKASRNERCQKANGVMRCVCRPGFARMFPERPCKPTYTYTMEIPLGRLGKDPVRYSPHLAQPGSAAYHNLLETTKQALDRMVMQSDLRDVYHGLAVTGFKNDPNGNNMTASFYIQLSENTEETELVEVFKKHLKTNNYSMGGTDLHAAKEGIDYLKADDFNECADTKFHDCSENAECFNLRGSYTCSCKEGFTDLSHNTLFPGRVCSAELIGCERCNFHGNCFSRNDEEELCECFMWYAGQYCQINLKVLLLALSLVGASLIVLLVVCLVLSCLRGRRSNKNGGSGGGPIHHLRPPGFRLRPASAHRRHLDMQDKRAMISLDTSSEASMEHTPPPYLKQSGLQIARPQKPRRKSSKAPSPPLSSFQSVGPDGGATGGPLGGGGNVGTMEQRDRSLTVMIPRAKYRPTPGPQTSSTNAGGGGGLGGSLLTMSTFGPEQKLLKYLTTEKPHGMKSESRKPSNSTNQSTLEPMPVKKLSYASQTSRKHSTGALVSAGFEVSATVGRTKEIQDCYIAEPHTDLNQSGFNTIRTADSTILLDIPPPPTLEAELLDSSQVDLLTVSEARSYDETTIQPPTKCIRNYDKHNLMNDESHTMVERDIGSTFVMPQAQLYKRERGNESDLSNFDSL